MTASQLQISRDPGRVWRVGFEPDPWRWSPWEFATDRGRFNGRWDDQEAGFRTLYTGQTLRACLLEVCAQLRPNDVAYDELAQIVDDDHAVASHPDPERGAVGLRWLGGRRYGSGFQSGSYAEVTFAESIAFLVAAGVFERLGIAPREVDASLLKDARRRDVTRTVARFLYELQTAERRPLVDGVAFRSRMGDELRVWAIFEREERPFSEHIEPDMEHQQLTEDNGDLLYAFSLLGLHWSERS